MMAIHNAPGVTTRIHTDGHLRLTCRTTGREIDCEPIAAAMWIALKQHHGDVDRAARALSALWGTDTENIRHDLTVLAGSLCSLGLLCEV